MTKKMVFICGAARSGTTLLTNLLDGHPSAFMLPSETHILQEWNYHKTHDTLERYFLRDFFNSHDVLLFTCEETRIEWDSYLNKVYKTGAYVKWKLVDRKDFIRKYLEVFSEDGFSLKSVYQGLFKAVMPQEEYENDNKLLIDKRPFENEVSAELLAKEFPDAKFIHIIRDPRARYLSAKMRTVLPRLGFLWKQSGNVNGLDFATAHSQIAMTSMELARLNQDLLGDKYHVVCYEDLVKFPEQEMKKIASFLKIDFNDILLRQTSNKEEQEACSSVDGGEVSGVTDFSEARLKKYYRNTSYTERMILNMFTWKIGKYFNYDLEQIENLRIKDLLLPLKWEGPEDYLPNRNYMLKNLRGKSSFVREKHFHNILNQFSRGETITD
tara:strand:- start:126 stop:1274 length:1149 start_codon:yes stop_codon:yes gene_type:complete